MILRAAVAPERFLTRGFARYLSRSARGTPEARARASVDPGIALPRELRRFLDLTSGSGLASVGDFVVPGGRFATSRFTTLLTNAERDDVSRAKLVAILASAVPFGTSRSGAIWIHVLADASSPERDVVAALDPAAPCEPRLVCRSSGAFAVFCAVPRDDDAPPVSTRLGGPGIAEEEAVRAALVRARTLADLLVGTDAQVRAAAKALARRPPGVAPSPPHTARARTRTVPIALGALVETFFRDEPTAALEVLARHADSADALVGDAARTLAAALTRATVAPKRAKRSSSRVRAPASDLIRRREMALRAARSEARAPAESSPDPARLTRAIVATIDATKAVDPTTREAREEALLALGELGDRTIVSALLARAVTGDEVAVEMLAATGDESLGPRLLDLVLRDGRRLRQLESAVVRALAAIGARDACPTLRMMLADNPMTNWRDGIERASLVRELVTALGILADEGAGELLLGVLEAKSQEYRAIVPLAAWAVGRIRYLPALPTLERLLSSPKEVVTCEAIWAVGEVAHAHPSVRTHAATLLEGLAGLEPGAEITRLTAIVKARGARGGPRAFELRRTLDRALWEPGFRQEETSRRRVWALRAMKELADLGFRDRARSEFAVLLGHESIRHFVTRDDPRVRRAAEEAFTAWEVQVPKTRRYYAFVLDELERRGGLDALHDALRDPLGVYRHNVATRLAELADPRSIRPLAEATARLFSEPPTSTYEYDDAPAHVVAFVRALAKANLREGNDVLIEGLRSGHHQVRAVVAENTPEDPRFVPELMAMLGDPRSFLRSRAEKSLASLGALGPLADDAARPELEGRA